jgi:hypothetical protein
MIIIDGQIDFWEKGTPSAHHRQQPYLAEQAIAAKDAAGVDRALIHPGPGFERVGDRGGAEIPDRFAIIVAHWKERPGRAGVCAFLPTTGTRNPGSQTARSTGCGRRPTGPECRVLKTCPGPARQLESHFDCMD